MAETFKVILIEDVDEDAELVLRFVKKYSPDVEYERVQTGAELQQALLKQKWDLILSDYRLPTFSGPEAIKLVKETKSDVPLILVSGTIGEEIAVEAVKMGAIDYVLKSNLGRLPTSIEHAIREKKAEGENRKLMKQLEQAQKMEAVGRLAGGVAHDVNNALATITIYGEMALEQIESSNPKEARKSIEGILGAQQSAAGIVRQLLSFSRKNFEPPKIVDFAAVLSGVSPLIKTLLGARIEFKIQSPSARLEVLADPTQIEQVIMNLAVNARDAMTQGGTFSLTLGTQQVDVPPPEARLPMAPGSYVCLSARDSGSGMSAEVLERIFEPFFTTKEVGKGTGLGLSVIYGIIKQAKGTLVVESEEGRGTEFKVFWPASQGSKETVHKNEPKSQGPTKANKQANILLVEDDHSFRVCLLAMLRKNGYSVTEASSGEEALKIVSSQKLDVHILITDMVMPGMSGSQLAKDLQGKISMLPVLYLSGYADDTMAEYKIDANSTWFLQKPFTSKAFIEKVSEVLNNDSNLIRKDS